MQCLSGSPDAANMGEGMVLQSDHRPALSNDCEAMHQRLADAATVAASLTDMALACIALSEGTMPPVMHLRSGLEADLDAPDLPELASVTGGLVAIADVTVDRRLKTHPWVVGKPHFRFMAVVALSAPTGDVLGMLYLFDTRNRRLDAESRAAIEALARQIGAVLADAGRADTAMLPKTEPSKTEKTLRQLIRSTPVALAMFDREMRYIAASDAWADAFGMSNTNDIGRSQYDVFPDVPEKYRTSHQRSLHGEVFRIDEDHWINQDGSSGWYRWEQRPWRNVDGTIGGIILFAEDITDTRVSAAILRMLSVEATGLSLPDFLKMCAIRLADILELDRVHIAQPSPDEPGWIQTLTICANGGEAANERYALAGTPCGAALEQGTCFCPANVQAQFPKDRSLSEMGIESYVGLSLRSQEGAVLGMLAGTSRRPLANGEQVLDALRVASIGIGAALERHHAAEVINENVQFNHSLLNALTSHIAVLDATGRIVFTNHSWDQRRSDTAFDVCSGEVGSDLVERCEAAAEFAPEATKLAELLRQVLAGAIRQDSLEFSLESCGTMHWYKCTIKRFPGPASAYVLVALEDITEIKEALRRTDHVQQQFRHLFESAPDAIIMVDHSGRIRLANRKAAQMFGYSADALVGQPVEILVDPRSRDKHVGLRRHFFESPRERAMGDTRRNQRGRRRDGTLFPVEISLSRFFGNGEDADQYVIAAVRDITTRLQAQADRVAREVAETANEAKSIFLATMSHEIRTPLSAVLGLSEVMSRGALSHDQLRLLGSMRDSAGHLLRLIDDVLDFSKIEAGNLEIEEAPVDLRELVESTALGLADHAQDRNVALHLFVAPELPARVLSDEVRLRQIIYNLLGNAIKFSAGSEGNLGRVSLRAETDRIAGKPALSLVITDDGIGMTPEVMEKLFRPFTQGEGATTRKFGGTGLGLAICKRIIDRIGGEISVKSQSGQGTCFTVRLPLKVLSCEAGGASTRLAGFICLLCESTAYERDELRRHLEYEGAKVLLPGTDDACIVAQAAEGSVLIIGTDDAVPEGIARSLPRVTVGPTGTHGLSISPHGHIFVDNRAMPAGELVRAVALALGQEPLGETAMREVEVKDNIPNVSNNGSVPPILVAEDDMLNQLVILRQLEILGLRADIADNGADALEKWRNGTYALLLTDLHMPVMDGYALTVAIRSDEAQTEGRQRMPILALTANALHSEDNRARRIGMDGYLTKPISLAKLSEALRRWLPEDWPVEMSNARSGTQKAIDRSAQSDLIGDDPTTIHEFLITYHRTSQELVARFRKAAAEGALDEATMILHRLKSSSRWVGARSFGDLCEALEAVARTGDRAQLASRMTEFSSLHARVITEIEDICNELPDQA